MSYRIAITSSDGKSIDQHFGKARRFYIIQIEENLGEWEHIELREVDENKVEELAKEQERPWECSGHNDVFLDYISHLLNDCEYLLTSKIGKKPYKILQQNHINSLESPLDLAVTIHKLNGYYLKNLKEVK